MTEPLIRIAEAARQIGLNRSTLTRQIKAGMIRNHKGLVRLTEVLEDRANNINERLLEAEKAGVAEGANATANANATNPCVAEADEANLKRVIVDGVPLPYRVARALKETYLARLRQLEFETKSGKLVDGDTVRSAVFNFSRQDRTSWTNWPARAAPLIAAEIGADPIKVALALEKHVRQHQEELGNPKFRLGAGDD